MVRTRRTHDGVHVRRHLLRLRIVRLGRKTESASLDGQKDLFQVIWNRRIPSVCGQSVRPKSQTDLAGSEDNYLYRSRSLSALHLAADGTRPPPKRTDQKPLGRVLPCFRATGDLK